jgi:hypothetical protein
MMTPMSGFEQVLLKVYTDPRFRAALRNGLVDLSQYNLSAQEIIALNGLDFNALEATDMAQPNSGSCGRRC